MKTFDADLIAAIPRLRSFARTLAKTTPDHDDLVQATLERALRYRDGFTSGTDMKAWLGRIMFTHFIAGQRRRYRTHEIGMDCVEAFSAIVDGGQEAAMRRRDFWRGIAQISPDQSSIVLANIAGHSHAECASRFSIPIGTVKSRSSRGVAALTALIAGNSTNSPQLGESA